MTARARMSLVGFVLPAALAVAAVIVMIAVAPTLPDPIATHWSTNGVDGFGPFWASAILPPVIVGGYSVLVGVLLRSSGLATTVIQKLLLVTAPFLAGMISVIGAGSVWIQRGLADAADAPSIVPVVLTGLVVGLALAVGSWFILPAAVAPEALPVTDLPTLDLAATERAAWVQHAGPRRHVGVTVIVLLTAAIIIGGVALWATAPVGLLVGYLVVMAAILVLGVGSLFWRVTVDRRGFRVVSVLGWPRFSYPLATIESASVANVNPIGDFGGWGVRWALNGRFGIILGSGEALAVKLTSGKSVFVTVPRARTGAALLNSLVSTRVE